jgi:hypothetical protein
MEQKARLEDLQILETVGDPGKLIFTAHHFALRHGSEPVGNISIHEGEHGLYMDNIHLKHGYRGPIADAFVAHGLSRVFETRPNLQELFLTAAPQGEEKTRRQTEHLYSRYKGWGAERLHNNPHWSHRFTREAVMNGQLSKVKGKIRHK